jgi:anti-anti-sigma regulatory factor
MAQAERIDANRPQSKPSFSMAGAHSLRTAPDLREKILQAFAVNETLTVDAGEAESVDIGTIQVLLAAQKSAEAGGKTLCITASLDSPAVAFMMKTGFVNQSGHPLVSEVNNWVISGSSKQ